MPPVPGRDHPADLLLGAHRLLERDRPLTSLWVTAPILYSRPGRTTAWAPTLRGIIAGPAAGHLTLYTLSQVRPWAVRAISRRVGAACRCTLRFGYTQDRQFLIAGRTQMTLHNQCQSSGLKRRATAPDGQLHQGAAEWGRNRAVPAQLVNKL
jgi:hypothetical protein